MTDKIILKDGKKFIISFRDDGYINATELCQVGKKRFNNWFQNEKTKDFLKILSTHTKIPADKLIDIKMDGKNEERGSWVHPRVLTNIAQWISPEFDVLVTSWIEEWKALKLENTKKYIDAIENIDDTYSKDSKEAEVRDRLCAELGGEIEVETEYGFIDIVTDTEIIEVKKAASYKHAIGQILCYSNDKRFLKHCKRIHLFDITDSFDIEIVTKLCGKYDIIVTIDIKSSIELLQKEKIKLKEENIKLKEEIKLQENIK